MRRLTEGLYVGNLKVGESVSSQATWVPRVKILAAPDATIHHELLGRPYQSKEETTRPQTLDDVLFIASYNA